MASVGLELQHEIEQFLYQEAALLDDGDYHGWLAILADDIQYWMPTRYNRTRRERELDASSETELAFFDDDRASLGMRVKRLDTGMAWAEDPPSRTRHIITNIEVEPGDTASELKVYSNYLVYRTRGQTEQDFYVGRREDVLQHIDGTWKIARRKIVLDQNVLLAKNVSIFF